MYGRITQEFKCLKRWDKNSYVSKDKIRMLLFGIQRYEFQSLETQDQF